MYKMKDFLWQCAGRADAFRDATGLRADVCITNGLVWPVRPSSIKRKVYAKSGCGPMRCIAIDTAPVGCFTFVSKGEAANIINSCRRFWERSAP